MPTLEEVDDKIQAHGEPVKSPEKTRAIAEADEFDEEDLEDVEETLAERLWGLTEMFPESVRNGTSKLVDFSINSTISLYSIGKTATWVLASSAVILALPVMFETERAQMEEQQLQQQRQILLGPNAAVAGPGSSGMMPGFQQR